jgi:DNA-binding response OmpR family regulator
VRRVRAKAGLSVGAVGKARSLATGFELGADDYLTKPFELRELVLRLRALDRRRAHKGRPCERSQVCGWIRSVERSTATAATSR